MTSRLLRDAVLWHQPQSLRRSLSYTLVVAAIALVAVPSAWRLETTSVTDGHAIVSLDLAIARALCGAPSTFSRGLRIPVEAGTRADLQQVPIRDLLAQRAGSVAAYCGQLDQPFVNSENSLMLVETAILRTFPGASLSQVAHGLHAIRIACILIFVLLLVDLGSSLGLALGTLLCGLMLLQSMPDFAFTNYPFFFSLVLLIVAVHVFAIRYRWSRRWPGLCLYGAGAGVLSAFMVNMRTSYLPVVGLCFAAVLIDEIRQRGREMGLSSRGWRAAAMAGCFVAAYLLFQGGFITRHLPDENRFNASHPFGHPLVLGLAVPESDFSRAHGIRWSDEVGPRLANTVDPGVPFLGPRYNDALLKYYSNLWQAYPRDMLHVYYTKFALAGSDMLRVLQNSPGPVGAGVSLLLAPLAILPNGIWILALYVAIMLTAFWCYYRRRYVAAFALALLTLAACLVQVESGVIFPVFVKQYHNYAAFYALFISLLGAQALVNGAAALMTRRSRSEAA